MTRQIWVRGFTFIFKGIEMEHIFFFLIFNRNGTLIFAGIGRSEMDLVKVVFNS